MYVYQKYIGGGANFYCFAENDEAFWQEFYKWLNESNWCKTAVQSRAMYNSLRNNKSFGRAEVAPGQFRFVDSTKTI